MDKAMELLSKALSEVKAMSVEEYNDLFDLTILKQDILFSVYKTGIIGDIGYIPSSRISSSPLLGKLLISNNTNQYNYNISAEYTERPCSVDSFDLDAA